MFRKVVVVEISVDVVGVFDDDGAEQSIYSLDTTVGVPIVGSSRVRLKSTTPEK